MTCVEFAPEVSEDLDRIFDHLEEYEIPEPRSRIEEIIGAINSLEHNPLLGRPIHDEVRELIIGRQSRGYIALYRYIPEIDIVFVLAIKSQKDAGYKRL